MNEEIRFTCLVIGIIMTQVVNLLYFRELEKEIKELKGVDKE